MASTCLSVGCSPLLQPQYLRTSVWSPCIASSSARQQQGPCSLPAPLLPRLEYLAKPCSRGQVAARAGSNEGPGTEASGMTRNEALEVLGLSESASFDRIMLTKNKLTQNTKDLGVVAQVEAAYDVLLMENMKQRLTGEVARSVRFADVKRPAPPKQSAGPRKLPGGLTLVTPQQDVLLKQSGVFAALAAWTLVGALTAPPSPMGADAGAPGIQLALAVGASVYFMRESQKLSLGRSAAITAGGFVAGTVVGAVLNNFLRVDIVPIGAFSSPGALVGEFSILGMWAASAFLR